jgi:hypothetical protein
MSGYTFRMELVVWVFLLAVAAGFAHWYMRWRRRRAELKRAAEERLAALMAEAMAQARKKSGAKA